MTASMKAVVLTYHAHHVVGDDYARNDHIALAADLELITDAGCAIVPLAGLVDRLLGTPGADGSVQVAITFDDGPIYDFEGFTHPRFGPQRGFLPIMRDFIAAKGARAQPALGATSFVIASPEARRTIEATYDAAYTYVGAGAMTDAWSDFDRESQLGPPAPGVAAGCAFKTGAGGFHAGSERCGRRRADRAGRSFHRRAHETAQRAVLRLSVRAVERFPGRGLFSAKRAAARTAGGIYRRAAADHPRRKPLAAAALHLRSSLEKPRRAALDTRASVIAPACICVSTSSRCGRSSTSRRQSR